MGAPQCVSWAEFHRLNRRAAFWRRVRAWMLYGAILLALASTGAVLP